MELRFSTWQEVDVYLQDSKTIILPIGSTEQHGPNGLIGTDALCPESLAIALGENTGALVAPTIPVGMAQHHMAFARSITLLVILGLLRSAMSVSTKLSRPWATSSRTRLSIALLLA